MMEADEEGALGRPQVQRAQLIDIKAAELKVGFSKPPVIGCLSDRNFVPAIANLGFARIATGCRDPIARTSDASKPARPDDGNLVFADRDRRDVPRAARQALSALQRSYKLNPGLPWVHFYRRRFRLMREHRIGQSEPRGSTEALSRPHEHFALWIDQPNDRCNGTGAQGEVDCSWFPARGFARLTWLRQKLADFIATALVGAAGQWLLRGHFQSGLPTDTRFLSYLNRDRYPGQRVRDRGRAFF